MLAGWKIHAGSGVLALGVAVAAFWFAPVEPDGCPENGCRVGYRFEDGGISLEGWEPYETDDPVVALLDGCLTYFMTGEPGVEQISIRDEGENGIFLSLADLDETVRINNAPFRGPWGTFRCDNVLCAE